LRRVLIDTSILVPFLRGRKYAEEMEALKDRAVPLTCGIVVAELLEGVRKEDERRELSRTLSEFERLEIRFEDFERVGNLGAKLLAKGIKVPLTDLVLAVLCQREDVELWTSDKHFDYIEGLKRYG
jgi:hypothetical protein